MTLHELSFLISDIYLVDEKVQKTIISSESKENQSKNSIENIPENNVQQNVQKFDFEHFILKNKLFLIVLQNRDDIYIKNAKNELALANIMKAVAGKQILVKENESFKEDNCCFITSQNLKDITENDLTGEIIKELNNYLPTTLIQKIFIFDEKIAEISQKIFLTKNILYLSENISNDTKNDTRDNITLLQAHSITEIEKDINHKKALWKELQVMFLN